MQFLVVLATLLLSAFQAHGYAIPSPTSITADNETATVGVQRFESIWVQTADSKLLCADSGMTSMTDNFAREADCKVLASNAQNIHGYWDTFNWSEVSVAKTITDWETCKMRISVPSLPGGDGHIWIGNGDVRQVVGQAVAGLAHAGQVAAIGQLTCSDPNGETIVNWSISS
ncbi:hypothetical protein PG993_008875 [Apiospora rasikravindrae]|uniref:Ecp2 effector protein-like domain-containing protein n=1 Tax=Apiospora rasikravindrae TaxID=990691 RepID=A0ABR1SQZ9_9PEZI